MEKRLLGIILSILGIIGLIIAAVNFINGGSGSHHFRAILAYGILGVLFFTQASVLFELQRTNLPDWLLVNTHVTI
jgi:hypothetical protein